MFINITDKKEAENKGSSGRLVHYLEKENRTDNREEPEYWFNGHQPAIGPYEVMRAIDGNIAKLGRDDAKFFLINISPSKKEIAFLKKQYGEDGAREQLKGFAVRVMDEYAKNFKRPGINSHRDLVWFAKLENHRYYTHGDPEVKKGVKKRGERKEGEQMHVQVIVSRKDATNRIKLSPQNTSRGRNAEHSRKMGQFDRVAFKQSGETLFDGLFGFDRQLKETMAYANTQKRGSLAERQAMASGDHRDGAAAFRTDATDNPTDIDLAPQTDRCGEAHARPYDGFIGHLSIDIADDIDDEAIHGRNRQRKRKARTNTR